MSRLLIHRNPRHGECETALRDEVPALQAHVANVFEAGRSIGVEFARAPASLEEFAASMRPLVVNTESEIMAFEADLTADTADTINLIKLELLKAGSPTLSVGSTTVPIDAEKILELNLISVSEDLARSLVLARRHIDKLAREFAELLPFISITATGEVVVDDAVNKFMDDRYNRYANSRQLAAWKDLQDVVSALDELRAKHGLTIGQIVQGLDEEPGGSYTIDPGILSRVGQVSTVG